MNELKLPYIGVKIESLYTILKVLSQSKDDGDFVEFYVKLGKSKKTATEYLASLRNLNLAKKNKAGDTELLPQGKMLLEDNIEHLYTNLLSHCLKHFPDLKIVRNIIVHYKISSLSDLIKELANKGYSVNRVQTLSSYMKMFYEVGHSPRLRSNFTTRSNDPLEYNQFVKLAIAFGQEQNDRKIKLTAFFQWLKSSYDIPRELYMEYLTVLKNNPNVRFYEVNPKLLKDDDLVVLNNKTYYYIEFL